MSMSSWPVCRDGLLGTSELRGGSPAARWWSVVIAGALGYVGCVYIYTGQCRLMMKPQAQKSSWKRACLKTITPATVRVPGRSMSVEAKLHFLVLGTCQMLWSFLIGNGLLFSSVQNCNHYLLTLLKL